MTEVNLFGEPFEPQKPKMRNKKRDAWNRRFQKWSDTQALDGRNPDGKCGYGYICDWCEDNSYGKPCVRALNSMLREKRRSINYETADYATVFFNGKDGDGA